MVEFLKRCVGILVSAGCRAEGLPVRVDSGHDSSDFVKALCDLGEKFIVKYNIRKGSPEQFLPSVRWFLHDSGRKSTSNSKGRFTVKIIIFVCLVLSVLMVHAQKSWHQPRSPYRAVFTVRQFSNHAQGGVLLKLPLCGGDPDGKDVFCYDNRNRQLMRTHLGRGDQNTCMVLVQPDKDSKEIYAYYGSGSATAPVYKLTPPVTCEVRTLPQGACRNKDDAAKLLAKSELIGRMDDERFCQVTNPVSDDLRFIMVYEGYYYARSPGKRVLFVASSGPAYLYVDGELEIERGEAKGYGDSVRGENRKEMVLKEGVHHVKLVAFALEETPKFLAALGKCVMDGVKVRKVDFVSPNEFVTGGRADLVRIEGKNKSAPVPQFRFEHKSYIQIEGAACLTETEFSTYSGQEAVWKFGDGIVMKGAKVTRVFAEVNGMSVETSVKHEKVKGRVMFSSIAPNRRQAGNRKDLEHYLTIMEGMGLESMNRPQDILGMMALVEFSDCHRLMIPLARAYLKCKRQTPQDTAVALSHLARSAANVKECREEAQAAFDKLLKMDFDKEDKNSLLAEAVEFAVFAQRDYALAERWLKTYGARLGDKRRGALKMDVFIQSGRLKEALEEYQKLMEGKRFGANQRSSAVRGSSFQEEAERAMDAGRLLDAARAMEQWAVEAPMDRGNGSFSLVRARLFERRGWLEGAEGELKGAISADKELPNLPDVEFELAKVYDAMGRQADARALYGKIAEKYPRHPLAKEAAKKR